MSHPTPTPAERESPLVAVAEMALRAFGSIDRNTARMLLHHWRWTPELSPREIVAVLDRFPDPDVDERGNRFTPPQDMPPRGTVRYLAAHGLHRPAGR